MPRPNECPQCGGEFQSLLLGERIVIRCRCKSELEAPLEVEPPREIEITKLRRLVR